MMTKDLVLKMVEEAKAEEKKTIKVPHYFKRNGKMVERSYPDYVETERYIELLKELHSEDAKVFQCGCCGEMVGYYDLETWLCNFEENHIVCASCYEDEMGEDL